jgi:protein LTV1
MGKTKAWIDKKNSTTFRLVYRSQRDDGVQSAATPQFVPKKPIPKRKMMKNPGLKEFIKNQPVNNEDDNRSTLFDQLDEDELKQFEDAEEIDIEEAFEGGDVDEQDFDDADEDVIKEFDDDDEDEEEEEEEKPKVGEKPKEQRKRLKYRADDYEYGDLGFPDDGYDYSQHFKKHDGESVFITARGAPTEDIKKLFLSTPKAFNPQPSEADLEEIDPEILEALNQDFDDAEEVDGARELGDLPDNFLELAGGENEGGDQTDALPPPKDQITISKKKKKKIGKIIELPPTTDYENPSDATGLNERFAALIAENYRDEDIGDLEDEDIRGTINVNSITNLLDEFESSMKPVQIKGSKDEPAFPIPSSEPYSHQSFKKVLAAVNEKKKTQQQLNPQEEDVEDEDEAKSEEEYEVLEVTVKSEWDCQSLVSTYSNTENHPKLIKEPPASAFKIPISKKTGLPIGVLPPRSVKKDIEKVSLTNFNHPDPALLKPNPQQPQSLSQQNLQRFEKANKKDGVADEEEDDDEKDDVSVTSVSTTLSLRPPNETPEERKIRKQQTKLLRKQNRERKKILKQRYQQEDLRLKNIAAQQPLQKVSIMTL